MGIRHFCVGWDVMVLHQWLTEQGKAMQEILSGVAAPALVGAADGKQGTYT